jgi:hypothetical protein
MGNPGRSDYVWEDFRALRMGGSGTLRRLRLGTLAAATRRFCLDRTGLRLLHGCQFIFTDMSD